MKRAAAVVAVACAALVAVAAAWLVRSADSGDVGTAGRAARTPEAAASRAVATAPAPATTSPSCAAVPQPFDPRTVTVPGVVQAATVISPPREADAVPGVPPLTNEGKREFAWDRAQGTRPGDQAGNVLLNAHTWPDGSALGNRLLAGLQVGDPIVVNGAAGDELCYRVTERLEVTAAQGLARYYATDGPPQLAIVVCSGRRTGPGEWTHRTVWFASPSA
jgi:hypothetical protein